MLYVTAACFLAWAIPRRAGRKWAVIALVLVTVLTSFYVVNDVRTAGVREDFGDYSIVYYKSAALFPFVVQMHHNPTQREFFYRVLLLSQDGGVMYETGYTPDQPEFMHLALFQISVTMCFVGFVIAVWVIVCAEILWWWLRGNGNHRPIVSS